MSPYFWVGERECRGKTSIYRGPILLTYDRRYNEFDIGDLPHLDGKELEGSFAKWEGRLPPFMLLSFPSTDGRDVRLCDYGSAGLGGSQ